MLFRNWVSRDMRAFPEGQKVLRTDAPSPGLLENPAECNARPAESWRVLSYGSIVNVETAAPYYLWFMRSFAEC